MPAHIYNYITNRFPETGDIVQYWNEDSTLESFTHGSLYQVNGSYMPGESLLILEDNQRDVNRMPLDSFRIVRSFDSTHVLVGDAIVPIVYTDTGRRPGVVHTCQRDDTGHLYYTGIASANKTAWRGLLLVNNENNERD